ncbi:DUF2721 domain-containing protein [Hyphococcus luteus]|uniref:DUF2721 domain-containing protein n=1 Tax=Hyphococcus luteus TaxID=2058213 RepID=A0A2S7K7F9_9PROT|nr:DUF2721 domain-containing protein [Marinicaulis flavus]PQA88421.1 DUF2721 domain-containing protein [Marinicaulis flavus]
MNQISDIAHIIELAVAPVFLLAGIGSLLGVVTTRLARVIDRARHLEERALQPRNDQEAERIRAELVSLDRRMQLAQRAVLLFSIAALLVCLVVATLFIGDFIDVPAGAIVAVMFIAAMVSMAGGLSLFLREIYLGTRALKVREELLSK